MTILDSFISLSFSYLHVIWDFSVVDGYLQLAFARLTGIDPELARLADHAVANVRHLDQRGVVHLKEDRRVADLVAARVDVHDERAHLGGLEQHAQKAVFLFQPAKEILN